MVAEGQQNTTTQLGQTPVEVIERLKDLERVALPTYLEERGNFEDGHWILVSANENETKKLGFSPAYRGLLADLWVVPRKQHLDLIGLTGYIIEGPTEPIEKARAIAEWIY